MSFIKDHSGINRNKSNFGSGRLIRARILGHNEQSLPKKILKKLSLCIAASKIPVKNRV